MPSADNHDDLATELERSCRGHAPAASGLVEQVARARLRPSELAAEVACRAAGLVGDATTLARPLRRAVVAGITADVDRLCGPSLHAVFGGHDRPVLRCGGRLVDELPVLRDRLTALVAGHLASAGSMHDALTRDGAVLRERFGFDAERLRSVRRLDADPHDGQRRPFALVDRRGVGIVYKPRSLEPEAYAARVLARLAPSAARGTVRVPALFTASDHGWMEVAERGSPSPLGAARAVGVLLGLAATVQLTDLHAENVIAGPAGLAVVDAETVLLPTLDEHNRPVAMGPHLAAILPEPNGYGPDRWWDVSLAGCTANRWTVPSHFVYEPDAVGATRTARLARHRIAPRHARVADALRHLEPSVLCREIEEAFSATLDGLAGIVAELADADDEPPLATRRFIYRPTAVYLRTLLRLSDADMMGSWAATAAEVAPYLGDGTARDLSLSEIRSLVRGDVPRLTGVDLERLVAGPVPHLVVDAGSARATVHVGAIVISHQRDRFLDADPADAGVGSEALHRAVRRARELLIVPGSEGADWLGVVPAGASSRPRIGRVDDSLYGGLAGLALAVGLAGSIGADDELSELARSMSCHLVEAMSPTEALALDRGSGGVVFTLAALDAAGATWASSLLERAADAALQLRIPDEHDVVSGRAGALLLLTAVPAAIRGRAWEAAVRRLVVGLVEAQSRDGGWPSLGAPGLCGFAHGASGIRYALARGVVATGPSRPAERAMARASTFEDRHFDRRRSNWRDLRPAGGRRRSFAAWCHGAVGVAIAELGLARLGFASERWRVDAGLRWTTEPTSQEWYCCGRGGRVELVSLAAAAGIHDHVDPGGGPRTTRFEVAQHLSLYRGPLGTAVADLSGGATGPAGISLGLLAVDRGGGR